MFLNGLVLEEQTSDAILSRLPQGLKPIVGSLCGTAEAVPLRGDRILT